MRLESEDQESEDAEGQWVGGSVTSDANQDVAVQEGVHGGPILAVGGLDEGGDDDVGSDGLDEANEDVCQDPQADPGEGHVDPLVDDGPVHDSDQIHEESMIG